MLHGHGTAATLERLVCGDIAGLKPGRQRYTLLTTQTGGILDDLMVANLGDEGLFVVVNASRKAVDFAQIGTVTPVTVMENRALLALQGPAAAAVMARIAPGAADLPFMALPACASPTSSVSSPAPVTPARTGSNSLSSAAWP